VGIGRYVRCPNTYGITIEFIDALAVSKSATGETVKIVDVEVYDDGTSCEQLFVVISSLPNIQKGL
jgi:hypothetical protein